MTDCIFCKIVNKEIAVDFVGETQDLVTFKDIHPKAPVHLLIVPKKHIGPVSELKDSDACATGNLICEARKIAATLGLDKTGYRLVFNVGRDAGMEIDHLHLHLLGGKSLKFEF